MERRPLRWTRRDAAARAALFVAAIVPAPTRPHAGITPPVGLNLLLINRLAVDVPLGATIRGVLPFLASDAVRIALLAAVPAIVLAPLRRLGQRAPRLPSPKE
jgi:hypothetical protein